MAQLGGVWLKFPHEIALLCYLGLLPPFSLIVSHGWWVGAGYWPGTEVFLHMGHAMGLLECPQDMAAAFCRARSSATKGEAVMPSWPTQKSHAVMSAYSLGHAYQLWSYVGGDYKGTQISEGRDPWKWCYSLPIWVEISHILKAKKLRFTILALRPLGQRAPEFYEAMCLIILEALQSWMKWWLCWVRRR